jgi:S-adenosyl methyltransferase
MVEQRPSWAPAELDLELPNAARIYDYLLGGAANFKQDREFADNLLAVLPEARRAAQLNRAFLRRAVRFCVESGIRQFLDIGSGIPTEGNVHEIAQEIAPETTVLYVDNEKVAVTHAQAMLGDDPRTACLHADLTDPDTVLGSAEAARLLDFDKPIAVMMLAVLHFVLDSAQPHEAVARYVAAMPSGSALVLSHGRMSDRRVQRVSEQYQRSSNPGVDRGWPDIIRFFDGTELVEPGLVWAPLWRPEFADDDEPPESSLFCAGVGIKP